MYFDGTSISLNNNIARIYSYFFGRDNIPDGVDNERIDYYGHKMIDSIEPDKLGALAEKRIAEMDFPFKLIYEGYSKEEKKDKYWNEFNWMAIHLRLIDATKPVTYYKLGSAIATSFMRIARPEFFKFQAVVFIIYSDTTVPDDDKSQFVYNKDSINREISSDAAVYKDKHGRRCVDTRLRSLTFGNTKVKAFLVFKDKNFKRVAPFSTKEYLNDNINEIPLDKIIKEFEENEQH